MQAGRPSPQPGSRPGLGTAFTSLKYRNYNLWFRGQTASLVGMWMQQNAQGFLVFDLTHSPAFLGYVGFASGLPVLALSLVAGVVSDRMPRRRLLMYTQIWMMILAFILAGLTFTGAIEPWHILAIAFASGIASAFDSPTRLAFVAELVDREDLSNAIALNATVMNTATAIGPAIAGIVYATLGPAWCFSVNGCSYAAVLAALLMMDLKPRLAPAHKSSPMQDLKEGVRYVWGYSSVRALIMLAAVMTLFGVGAFTLFPAWAVNVLGGNATTNGFLQSSRGLGALGGALMIASLGRFKFKGRLLTLGTIVFPLFLLGWAQVNWLPLSLLLLVGAGWAQIVTINNANALVQTQVDDRIRGRVMSMYALAFFGMMPIGALVAGWIAEATSESIAVMLCGAAMLLMAAVLWIRAPYIRKLE